MSSYERKLEQTVVVVPAMGEDESEEVVRSVMNEIVAAPAVKEKLVEKVAPTVKEVVTKKYNITGDK